MARLLLLCIVCSCLLILGCRTPQQPEQSYVVEDIIIPEGLLAQVGAMDFLPNGKLIVAFTRGEVMTYDPNSTEWHLFAEGLHDPLGIHVISDNEILVIQLPELTRLKDTDGDGIADHYENVTDDFGITGNYHEFNYGPVKNKKDELFIALNASSALGEMRGEVRGEINLEGRDGETGNRQMYSTVPYRGWVLRYDNQGQLLPFASGFRSPNGMVVDNDDNLFVTDNQGDWVATSTLFHVEEGGFYGHPASLVWTADWNRGNPFELDVDTLDKMRTKASVLFPHGIMANSPSQPVFDNTKGKFGPFDGQLLVGEMNQERIVRVVLEEINGQFQGACMPFIDSLGLRKGNNRLAFAPDGSLWVGQNAHGWLGDTGIQRISYTGKQPMDILSMNLTETGFRITFTKTVDKDVALDMDNYNFSRYSYLYHSKYGSPQQDVEQVETTGIRLLRDRKTVELELADLRPGYVYELNLGDVISRQGDTTRTTLVCYTLNQLIE